MESLVASEWCCVFNHCIRCRNTPKGLDVTKNDTRTFLVWDVALALVLLTRLPIPRLPDWVFARQKRAAWAFPVVGLVLGALACTVGQIAVAIGLSSWVSGGLVVAVLILCAGAMHEDGLADTADGLWGGFSPERRLEIMKDSHIGTYGVLALILSQFLRISAVAALIAAGALWSLLAAAIWSRALMPISMGVLPNARISGLSHRVGRPSKATWIAGLGVALVFCFVLSGTAFLLPALCASATAYTLAVIAKSKIGGQTGDILGATQALSEIAFLLALAAQT